MTRRVDLSFDHRTLLETNSGVVDITPKYVLLPSAKGGAVPAVAAEYATDPGKSPGWIDLGFLTDRGPEAG